MGNMVMKRADAVAVLNSANNFVLFVPEHTEYSWAPMVCKVRGKRLEEVKGTVRRDTVKKMIAEDMLEEIACGTSGATYILKKA